MRYTVLWSRVAEERLAFHWTDASNRQAVTEAANAIDKLLQADPDSLGESRPDGTRILFVPPLGILYYVNQQERVVSVLTVWRFAKRHES